MSNVGLDVFQLPTKTLHNQQRRAIKYTQQITNEYRKILGEKPKPVVRVASTKGGKIVLDRMTDIKDMYIHRKRLRKKR